MINTQPPDYLGDNLRRLGVRLRRAGEPSAELLSRCAGEFERPRGGTWRIAMRKYKRPVLFSSVSLAAAIALFVGVLWPSADPTAYAARITETLARQSRQNPSVHVEFAALSVEEVTVSGEIHVGASGLAGDVSVTIADDEGPLKVDAAVAVTDGGGWVLVRKLILPDAEAQAVLNLLLPPGQETLVLLPKNSEIAHDVSGDIQDGLRELQSGEVIAVFKELIASHAEYGVTVEKQADGMVRLILPIEDEEALEALGEMVERISKGEGVAAKEDHRTGRHPIVQTRRKATRAGAVTPDEASGLVGATLSATYDPATETVRMLSISGLGEAKGSITVTLGEGDIDPLLLDSTRVAKPGTRTLDLSAIGSLIERIAKDHE